MFLDLNRIRNVRVSILTGFVVSIRPTLRCIFNTTVKNLNINYVQSISKLNLTTFRERRFDSIPKDRHHYIPYKDQITTLMQLKIIK